MKSLYPMRAPDKKKKKIPHKEKVISYSDYTVDFKLFIF